jgi:hypothetical protein
MRATGRNASSDGERECKTSEIPRSNYSKSAHFWRSSAIVIFAVIGMLQTCGVSLPGGPAAAPPTALYSRAFHRIRASSQPMEIQPILNTIKDLTERSLSIRGYL